LAMAMDTHAGPCIELSADTGFYNCVELSSAFSLAWQVHRVLPKLLGHSCALLLSHTWRG
jgi:hypothetical protein